MILKREQRWGLSLPLINREQNYRLKNEILLLKRKVRNWNCKNEKKGEREESLKLKTKIGEKREEREEKRA